MAFHMHARSLAAALSLAGATHGVAPACGG
jgi:hypothetical protein